MMTMKHPKGFPKKEYLFSSLIPDSVGLVMSNCSATISQDQDPNGTSQ
jgi:hypothetical protein